jgi:hypothetical protein
LRERIAEDDIFDLPPWITGTFERYFAFALVAAAGITATVGTVLVAWMGAKLIANWQRQPGEGPSLQSQIIRAHTLNALIAGTLSLSIGVASGWVAREAALRLLQHCPN